MAYHQLTDGRRIYFEHYAGPKTPFVLSHGWGMSADAKTLTTRTLRIHRWKVHRVWSGLTLPAGGR